MQARRQQAFPLRLLHRAFDVCVQNAQATMIEDRTHILNYIAGRTGDELDDHRYWLEKDGLSDEVVPPALEAAGMSQGAWRQLHQDIDACNGKRCSAWVFVLLCCTTGLIFGPCTVPVCYCVGKGKDAKEAYLGICRRYESECPQLMLKLTTAASYVEMPPTGYPHPYGKHNTEKDRGRFVFQIIVR